MCLQRQVQVSSAHVSAVVGLDTAANRLHAYTDREGDPLWSVELNGVKWKSADDRRTRLFSEAYLFFDTLPAGTAVFCEEPLAPPINGATTRLLGMAAGAIWAAHLSFDLWWFWVDSPTWKKQTVGKGNATKEQVNQWAQQQGKQFDAQDYYDAYALYVYGRRAIDGIPADTR